MRKIIGLLALIPATVLADPLDKGETYTTRQGPPEWMDGIDFTWLLIDYGVFALMVIALGWVLTKRISLFERFERVLCWPFSKLMTLASRLPIILREFAQGIVGLAILLLIVAWVMFCQWLYHYGLGAVAMAGLAFEAVLLVRVIRQGERPLPT
jgi:hypothetical protein